MSVSQVKRQTNQQPLSSFSGPRVAWTEGTEETRKECLQGHVCACAGSPIRSVPLQEWPYEAEAVDSKSCSHDSPSEQ